MPPAIDAQIRVQVIKEWLSGCTRDEIVQENKIGAGTVSNIINEWKKSLDNSEYESIRELAVFSKKEAMTLSDMAAQVRLNNYIQKSGADLEQIESLIANISNSQNPQELVETANQIAQITTIQLDKIPDNIKQQQDELQKLKEEIEKAGAILEEKNVDMQTIEQYKNLEKELKKYGFSMEHPHILLSILPNFKVMGYDPKRIVQEFSRIKSMKRMERSLKEYESQAARYRDVISACEDIIRLGIGIPELIAVHTAVIKKADSENIPLRDAAYRLMTDIENYEKMGGLKNEILQLMMQKFAIQQMSAPRERVILSLMRLQALGVTDGEVLNVYEQLNRMREKSLITQ